MSLTRLILAVGLACMAGVPGLTAQSRSLGPLAVRERNPLYSLFYVPTGESADVLPSGSTRLDLTFGYSNIFERSTLGRYDVYLDVERLGTGVMLRRGVGRDVEIGAGLTIQSNWGGFLDPVVQGLHDAFGLPNGDREREPQGQTALELRDNGRVLFQSPIYRLAPENALLFVKWAARQSNQSALSTRGALKIPVGPQGTSTGLVDVAIEVLGRRSWTSWHLHGMLGWTSARAPVWADAIGDPGAAFMMVAVERSLDDVSLLAQFATSGRYLQDTGVDELDDRPSILALGVVGRRETWRWEVSFVEDVPPNSPSVDFTIQFRFWRSWP